MDECSARIYRFARIGQDICLALCELTGLDGNAESPAKHVPLAVFDGCKGIGDFVAESACRFAEALRMIDGSEKRKANRFLKMVDRQRYIFAHGILRMELARQLGAEPENLGFETTEFGKPMLSYPHSHLKFSLSHSGRHIAIATASREVGVDIEEIGGELDYVQIAKRFFAEEEQDYVLSCDEEEGRVRFYTLWVRKEALLKASGQGLRRLSKASTLKNKAELSLRHGETTHYMLATLCSTEHLALALAVQERV